MHINGTQTGTGALSALTREPAWLRGTGTIGGQVSVNSTGGIRVGNNSIGTLTASAGGCLSAQAEQYTFRS